MTLYNFLYTRQKPQRYYQHVAFWICSYLPFLVLNIIGVYAKPYHVTFGGFVYGQFSHVFPSLFIDICFTYLVAYYLLPNYFRTRNMPLLITGISGAVIIAFILKGFVWYAGSDAIKGGMDGIWLSAWFLFTNFLNSGSLVRCGLFLCCLMLRNYYSKLNEKTMLMQENATAELQLLKAQVHPHFLFNTLNNIYSFSLRKSPVAASLVSKLSDTLQYMITECEAPLVPVSKEIKMLRDYIGLESVRYGERLKISITEKGNANDKMIAPLLLIPLLENSFKHGTSQVIDRAWIEMTIEIRADDLHFTLKNSKPTGEKIHERKNGIGLRNVEKRLRLLYPGRHRLEIKDEAESFEVFVSIPVLHTLTIVNEKR